MAAYEYTALDALGRELRGVLDGDSARQVRQLLREQSLLPVTVTEVSDAPSTRAFSFSLGNRIGTSDLALLTRQLSTLVRSGIPLEEALLAVSQQSEKARVQQVLEIVEARSAKRGRLSKRVTWMSSKDCVALRPASRFSDTLVCARSAYEWRVPDPCT